MSATDKTLRLDIDARIVTITVPRPEGSHIDDEQGRRLDEAEGKGETHG